MLWARILVCLLLALAGCGYKPLYGEQGTNNASVVEELAMIRIEAIPDRIGQASEALDSVPLIAAAVEGAGVEAGGLSGLTALIDGELTAIEWVEGLRRAERARTAA